MASSHFGFVSDNPCANQGVCEITEAGSVCVCPAGFTGPTCTVVMDVLPPGACSSQPCQNGAECADYGSSIQYDCDCRPGYTGLQCETDINFCTSNPCRNGGVCVDMETGFV